MAKVRRLTDKQMSNKRFRKTEDAIVRVFFEGDNYISPAKMAKRVGVSRSTIYHHHTAVRRIVPDYKTYIMRQYRKMIAKKLRRKNTTLESIYRDMLIFMMHNRNFLQLLIRHNDKELMERMVWETRAKAMSVMRMGETYAKVYDIYLSEIVALICEWARTNFEQSGMGGVLGDIMYLTRTAKIRLSGVRM